MAWQSEVDQLYVTIDATRTRNIHGRTPVSQLRDYTSPTYEVDHVDTPRNAVLH